MRYLIAFLLAIPTTIAADVPTHRLVRESATVRHFDPIRFFEGRTRGVGVLKVALHGRQPTAVAGRGRVEADGTLVLSQDVTQGSEPTRTREWRLREVSPDHYAGTLTDATGPVSGETAGGTLTLRFPSKGTAVEQVLTLSADGRSAQNVLTARKLGVRVARLDETITRLD